MCLLVRVRVHVTVAILAQEAETSPCADGGYVALCAAGVTAADPPGCRGGCLGQLDEVGVDTARLGGHPHPLQVHHQRGPQRLQVACHRAAA